MTYPKPAGWDTITINGGQLESLVGVPGVIAQRWAAYTSPRSASVNGVQGILSAVVVFRSSARASKELAEAGAEWQSSTHCRWIHFDHGGRFLGASRYCKAVDQQHIVTYALRWRHGTVAAYLAIYGVFGISTSDLFRMALRQDALISQFLALAK